jgi:hypothetical protein
MQPYELIEGHEKVTDLFGQWPSFHDGEVHRVVLDRMSRSPSGICIPTVEIHVRGWIIGPEITSEGFYKQNNDSIVSFLFEDVFDFELEGFNQQNVLSSLNLSFVEDKSMNTKALRVELEHCYLFSSEFTARKAKILSVVPYVEQATG